MAWQLDIHVLDVGQGQSVLIVASDPVLGAAATRTLLIDGGHQQSAPDIHNKIAAAGVNNVDVMISTNYDMDHLGGLIGLLRADNAWQLANHVAGLAVAAAWPHAANPGRFHVAAAAAAMAVMHGATAAHLNRITQTVGVMLATVPAVPNSQLMAFQSAQGADGVLRNWIDGGMPLGARLVATPLQRVNYAYAVAYKAGQDQALGLPQATVTANVAWALAGLLCTTAGIPALSTDGLFRNTRVIDIGNTTPPPPLWTGALAGHVETAAAQQVVIPPGFAARPYAFAPMGTELLWAGGAPANPATAPVAVVVSGPNPANGQGRAWQGPNAPVPVLTDTPSNNASIGVVVRFNNFAFMTCGDLPYDGEDALGVALTNHPLPNAAGAAVAGPPRIAAYTCGHHGANTATSNPAAVMVPPAFLNSATPRTPIISCGPNNYPHPHVQTTARLQAAASVSNFYLTNCRHVRPEVPYSAAPAVPVIPQRGHPQKGRVAGDNGGPGAHLGDIQLSVTQAGSQGAPGAGSYTVSYWDRSMPGVAGMAPAPGVALDPVNF
ncbi:hypothetical protein ACIP79_18610 [Streptomyces sp. NPDC088747]|uniref:hypothetical protein n=1 Tax=Streptomyces sp. NPDC088747 TaxID=3365886 RepID=UPI00381A7CDA